MKGVVTKLCDLASVQIPEKFLSACVDMQQVERELQNLSMRYANMISAEVVQRGDIVSCRAGRDDYSDGRTILLYTAISIPGAEAASEAVIGKKTGDCVATSLCEKQVKLIVEKITRPIPAVINDALIASIGIEGVATVDAYRDHVAEKKMAELQMENHKMATSQVMMQMINGSTFEYDEEEINRYLEDHMEEIEEEYRACGVELPTPDEMREGLLEQSKQGWMAEEFCRRNNIEIDRAAVEADADQMMEMMSLMGERVPDREQMIEEALRNAYVMELFGKIGDYVTEKMEG